MDIQFTVFNAGIRHYRCHYCVSADINPNKDRDSRDAGSVSCAITPTSIFPSADVPVGIEYSISVWGLCSHMITGRPSTTVLWTVCGVCGQQVVGRASIEASLRLCSRPYLRSRLATGPSRFVQLCDWMYTRHEVLCWAIMTNLRLVGSQLAKKICYVL